MRRFRRSVSRGFTLLEILAVLTILAILAAVAVPAVYNQLTKGKVKASRVLMSGIQSSLNAFQLDCGFYPSTEQGLDALVNAPTTGQTCKNYDTSGYYSKKKLPDDPFGKPFIYKSPGVANPNSFDLYSSGPDRIEGNEDDIKSWE
ncbi:MAG: gspG [Bacteriovoracaceae bacterium]|nr:gspG [Bacteriovoracaceae bacterium]